MSSNKSTGGLYKKYKTINESNSMSQWDTWSRTKKEQPSSSKKKQDINNLQWIGSEATPARPETIQNSYVTQSFQTKTTPKSSFINQSKAPAQLIQDILKGLVSNSKINTVNPYYSQQSQQKLTQILTSQGKLQAFISELQMQMVDVDISVVKNYQMLIILLKHISKSDVQIKHSSKGLQLNFNRNLMIKQENEIQKLQKKVKQKDQHIKQIVEEYESVIRNFNDVIEKLLEEKTNYHGHHYTHHHNHHHSNHSGSHLDPPNYK